MAITRVLNCLSHVFVCLNDVFKNFQDMFKGCIQTCFVGQLTFWRRMFQAQPEPPWLISFRRPAQRGVGCGARGRRFLVHIDTKKIVVPGFQDAIAAVFLEISRFTAFRHLFWGVPYHMLRNIILTIRWKASSFGENIGCDTLSTGWPLCFTYCVKVENGRGVGTERETERERRARFSYHQYIININ